MGRGIAYVALLEGFEVSLQDIDQEALEKAKSYIQTEMRKSADKGFYRCG